MLTLDCAKASSSVAAEQERREQILNAAGEYFRTYGFAKTTMGDLAKRIGFSTAYLYRFFPSKQAIGEAVCAMTLARIGQALQGICRSSQSATAKIRSVFECLVKKGIELFFRERKLHDIVVASAAGDWPSTRNHQAFISSILHRIITQGREAGEFERKTPIDEVCLAMLDAITCFSSPMLLQNRERKELDESVTAVSNLVLRSLAA